MLLMLKLFDQLVHIALFLGSFFAYLLQLALFAAGQLRLNKLDQGPLGLHNDLIGQLESIVVVKEVSKDQPPDQEEILVVEEHVTPSQLTVTPSSADLLDIVLDTLRHVVVNNRLDIAFVDAHTESDGADKAPNLVLNEKPLNDLPLLVCLTSMIALRVDPILGKNAGQEIAGALVSCVNEDAVEFLETVTF